MVVPLQSPKYIYTDLLALLWARLYGILFPIQVWIPLTLRPSAFCAHVVIG